MNQFSKRLEKALETVRTWSPDRQEAAAEVLEHMNKVATTSYKLNDEERADLEQALLEARQGEFASDAEVDAMFARHGL
jgi:HD superfamily phosphodiesterase